MQRPTGITILAILAGVFGVLGLLASLALLGIGTLVTATTSTGGFVVVAGLTALAYSLLSIVLAYGFWTLKSWAWPLGVGVEVLGIVQALLQFGNDTGAVLGLIVNLAVAGFILWYLFQPHVKLAFGRA